MWDSIVPTSISEPQIKTFSNSSVVNFLSVRDSASTFKILLEKNINDGEYISKKISLYFSIINSLVSFSFWE